MAPLTSLAKKYEFSLTLEATKAFEHLKEAMCQALVLAMPNFTKTFIMECDASGNGIDIVLKNKDPLLSKVVQSKESIYTKLFMRRKC